MNNSNPFKQNFKIKYNLSPSQIMTFVSGLHEVQADMIESAVKLKEADGFPEATAVINHIKAL